ncbi:penicillin acylase family protein [Streptomyces sp. MST-110588]|uniref:penicillin acylase family protein n=1 Tax=Streptomyces sp. MST-110588 TaxID=2833628 RepID=UPI001F5C3859|nr:penicillin acylase family protein [Streptomyces sp. MST-110588]UNO38803.1 penicillin acylase family protein [Streptomyces sp. MST-110588]
MRNRLRKLALAGVVLLTAAAPLPSGAAAAEARTRTHPSADGLSAEIRYTEYGIPHIVAEDYPDLGFGEGWAQAADQVCTLAEGFVTLRGERSRYFGATGAADPALSSATTNLAGDLYFKGVRESGTVEKLLRQPAPAGPGHEVQELMRGWVAGYNAWLRHNRVTDPACAGKDWVRPVTRLDVAMRGYALAVLGGQGRAVDGITAAQPPAGSATSGPATSGPTTSGPAAPGRTTGSRAAVAAARALFPQDGADMGSNAVAFQGSTTADGRGLLLGNPHYPWSGGRRFWQSQVTIPGELNAAGASLLGSSTISIGHNARVAWSHTVATGVPFSLHRLTPDPADPTAYLVDGRSEPMKKRTVTVPVQDGTTVTRTQWWTRYGPVLTSLGQLKLPWSRSEVYAVNDPNAVNMRSGDTSLAFSKADGVAGIERALRRTQGLPWTNTVAADAAGHTLYTQAQVLPRGTDDLARRCSTPLGAATYPATGLAVLDGSRSDCAFGSDPDAVQPGIFGPSAVPTLKDAPYAENSNDSAWLSNADRPLTGYPRIFGDIGTPRSLRTRGALEDVSAMAARGRLTVADLQRQQFANRAPAGGLAAADTAAACSALPGGTAPDSGGRPVDVREACEVIGHWDRTVRTDSEGALLFDRFWRKLTAKVPPAERWKTPFDPADPVHTPRTLNTAAPGFTTALADAVAELCAAGIPLDAPLGEHQFVVRNGKRIPVPGGTEALGIWNKTEGLWDPAGGGYREVVHGSSYIQAVGFDGSRCPVARTLLTYSQSSNPLSPHYSDQTELYSAGRMIRERFCEKDILASPELRVVRVHDGR